MAVEKWNRPAPPGFQGLHPDIPVTFYYRHLPHWRQDGATYFVTFRLAEHLYRCLQYIGDNPRRAGLSPDNSYRWVRSSWKDLGWDFEN
jgi:hypothetical protein